MVGLSAGDPIEVALLVAGAFEANGVRYVLGGSMASTIFGEPRATLDVDFAADLDVKHVDPLLARLGPDFAIDREWVVREVRRRGSFQGVHLPTMIRVDVFVPEWVGLHEWKWQQRRRIELPGGAGSFLDVTSAEGIALQKLDWYVAGGGVSDRQWRDIVGVLKASKANLDRAALLDWGARQGVSELLRRAMREAGVEEA